MGKQNYREVTSLMGSEAYVLSTTVCYFESWLTCTEPVSQVLSLSLKTPLLFPFHGGRN